MCGRQTSYRKTLLVWSLTLSIHIISTSWQGESSHPDSPFEGPEVIDSCCLGLCWGVGGVCCLRPAGGNRSPGRAVTQWWELRSCSCKQWTPLKAHLHCSNTFCTWVFVFFAGKQWPGMHQDFPSVSQRVMELLTVGAFYLRMSDSISSPLQNNISSWPQISVLWMFQCQDGIVTRNATL